MNDIDTRPENFDLVEAGLYSGEVEVWTAKARGLAEVLAVYSDGTVTGGDRIVAAWALECYAELINTDNKTEADHDEFARGIVRDHCHALSAEMASPREGRDYVSLSVFENTLMQRALRRYSKFLLSELKARPRQAIDA
jgi:hypothetical protein